MSIGANVLRLLEKNGKTQVELAEYCYVSHVMISKIVHDIKQPSVALVKRMAEFFQCSTDEILRGVQ